MRYSRKSKVENGGAKAPTTTPPDDGPAASGAAARSLYVHVPICEGRCRYCDFYSTVAVERGGELVEALLAELDCRRDNLQLPLDTIFVGGGTPSALPPGSLERLVGALARLAGPETEFSLEANCGSLTGEKIGILRAAGVNRLSVGVQSFCEAELRLLGRRHSASQASETLAKCRETRFVNLSVDLIYGIPNQTLATWSASLEAALAAGVVHLSCYGLDYPKGTALAADLAAGRVEAMDEHLELACHRLAIERCRAAGLEHYEISNFARPERRCRHNLNYWANGDYLGLGPGAVGCLGGRRARNLPDLEGYIARMAAGESAEEPGSDEILSGRMKMAETLMLGLRRLEGIDRRDFHRRFGVDIAEAFPETLARYTAAPAAASQPVAPPCPASGAARGPDLSARPLLDLSPARLRFTEGAHVLSDSVLADFIAEATRPRT